ncbi:hypothetical protein NLG97_g4173 [Lecanicillium saksenae]|uniref:Uncharacterized protein n=1 Tax=Lecanicillium saksenae TaxID=468837 RepID=A0ACC1QXC7_9HYPO|nr:hypothetical protein NLG97_g4173 [Lecanicillium saksenae]
MMRQVDTTLRLAQLRTLMSRNNIGTYIVPPGDSHSSEYVADRFKRVEFISGFSGSSAWAAISDEGAALTTDGRYLLQASQQLDANWTLFDDGWEDWVAAQCKNGKSAGVDPTLLSPAFAEELAEIVRKGGGAGLVAVTENLIDEVWGTDQPAIPTCNIFVHPEMYAGKAVKMKLAELRKVILANAAFGIHATMLDEVAWLFNLRGGDVRYNPVFYGYATIAADKAVLYVDQFKLYGSVAEHLANNGVEVNEYAHFYEDVSNTTAGKYMVRGKAPWALRAAIGNDRWLEVGAIADANPIKNDAEIRGMRACHIRDGAALVSFFAWLEDQVITKKVAITDAEAADKLLGLRQMQDLFVGSSFETISCSGSNAAIIHYRAKHGASSVIDPDAVYLCDSGAQYYDGTTDTTRTFHFGTPSEFEREAYTLVLKGLIALHRAVFPRGVTGYALNCLARQFLWNFGLNFRHGTSHGVGSFLNVHEGPIGIGSRHIFSKYPLQPGNVLPMSPVSIMMAALEWLNVQNAETLEKTQNLLAGDEVALAWLKRNTAPL